jgi:formate C-acetyltransferase
VLKRGFKGIYDDLIKRYSDLSTEDKAGKKGAQLKAMMTATTMPRELAEKYENVCSKIRDTEKDESRKAELEQMMDNLAKVPWEGAQNFWEAVQSLWLTHMLVMTDENYPGPGVSFGRIDQYLLPYWEKSIEEGMTREFGKEILGCFWFHCNTAYDAMIHVGANQGITAGYGQLFNLSGVGRDNKDMSNDLTYVFLEVIDEMSPILEPKPNVRLHRNSPDKLLDKVVDMISSSQGAPFLLNFDERSMAGLLRQAKMSENEKLINIDNVFDYACVGCLENTMTGNDRSGTVDNNLNILKAVELALNNGKDLIPFVDEMSGREEPVRQDGPATGDVHILTTWDEFVKAYELQTKYIVDKCAELYEITDSLRARYCPTPYLSCLVKGCAEKGLDVTAGGPELSFTTVEGVTFATCVDSLLAIKYLVYDKKECTLAELTRALKDNWAGHEVLQAKAKNRAPKYGRDDTEADEMAKKVMDLWTNEVWKHKTKVTNRQFRPGMLSWNYWVSDGYVMAASADGRVKGQFLSNAICPSNGADTNGPTANVNSVGNVLGGKAMEGKGDFEDYLNSLPNGASHTITFSPSLLRDAEHKEKFKAFLRGYVENGGTALQINVLDSEMLKDAQDHPENYRNLLVRVTGYNAYFSSIGRGLQDEIIARESHNRF